MVLTFESMDKILSETIQMKAPEQYFPVVLFVMLCKVVLTFKSVHEILMCDHSNDFAIEQYLLVVQFIMLYNSN